MNLYFDTKTLEFSIEYYMCKSTYIYIIPYTIQILVWDNICSEIIQKFAFLPRET